MYVVCVLRYSIHIDVSSPLTAVMNSLHLSFSFGDRDRYRNISTSDETELETVVVEEV